MSRKVIAATAPAASDKKIRTKDLIYAGAFGAMFLSAPVVTAFVPPLCWAVGLVLLTVGIVFYKVMKKEV